MTEEIPKPVEYNWLNSLKGIIKAGAFLTLLTPLLVSNKFFFPFVGPKSIYFMAVVEIIFFAWIVLAIFDKSYRPKINALTISIIVFLVIITLSGIFGVNPSNSFWSKHERITGLLMMYHLFGYFLVLKSTFKDRKEWMWFMYSSIGAGVLISILSFRPELAKLSSANARGGATLGNSSFLGSYLLFNFFFALYFLIKAKKFWKLLWLGCMILFFLAIILNDARAATLVSILGLILIGLFWISFIAKQTWFRWAGRGALVFLICAGCIVMFLVTQKDSFIQKLMIENTMGSRLITLRSSWGAFKAKPLLGWGWENFDSIWTKYYDPSSPTSLGGGEYWYDKAHNVVAETAATSGILGLLSYLSIFAVVFVILIKKFLKKKNFWLPAIFISLLIAYFLQNLTVFDMISSYILFFASLAFIDSLDDKEKEYPNINSSMISIGLGLIAVTCLVISLIFFVINPLKSSAYISKMNTAENSKERLGYYVNSILTSPLGKFQNRDFLARETLTLSRSPAIEKINPENFAQEVNFITDELEKTVKESKYDLRSRMSLSQIYAARAFFFNGSFDNAQKIVDETLMLCPNGQQVLWNAAQMAAYQKKYDKTMEYAQKAIEVAPNLPEAYYTYVKLAFLTKQNELAHKMVENSQKIITTGEFKNKMEGILEQYDKK
ncbi:MAG: O-antigen ligase family protein [Candidatus Pacebacteria bacterium]|nr:O-antigen ligase family protein [Candidatus Paceibacterota bacterium]